MRSVKITTDEEYRECTARGSDLILGELRSPSQKWCLNWDLKMNGNWLGKEDGSEPTFLADSIRIFGPSCGGRTSRKIFWLGRGEKETFDHRMRAAAHNPCFPECEGVFCVCRCCLCVSSIMFVRVSLRSQSPGWSRLSPSSLPTRPCSWAFLLDQWWLRVCILYRPKPSPPSFPHPSSSSLVSHRSPKFRQFCLINIASV